MSSCLVDINVWLALIHAEHVHHSPAIVWFSNFSDTAYFCRQTQLGFLRLLTNARVMGRTVKTQLEAWRIYDALLEDPRIDFLNEPANVETILRQFSRTRISARNSWADAYLAALARSLDLQLVSFDRGFSAIAGLNSLVLT